MIYQNALNIDFVSYKIIKLNNIALLDNEDIYAGIFNNVLSGKWYYKEDHNDTMISSK